ncbi:MAG: peptidase M23, partial [Cylindrospermopsis raciborskii KL1]|nr:peptidase M23 [Cylindrospermopsis raciborskii KL1]
MVTWGGNGGNSSSVASQLTGGVTQIFSTVYAFAALKSNGSVVTWGDSSYGGNSSSVATQLTSGVTQIFSTYSAFAALKSGGSVVTWGDSSYGGNSSSVAGQLTSGVVSFADPFNDDRLVPLSSVTLAVSSSTVTEDGSPNLVYTFTRTGVISNALTVNYTVGGTAIIGTDYTGISTTGITKTVAFAVGSSTVTVTVDPTTDTMAEPNETVSLALASGTSYTIGTTSAVTGTINNDDTNVTLVASPNSVTEDGIGNLIYTFTRTGVTSNVLTVNYTVGGTATFNSDYTQREATSFNATAGTITFVAGASTATLVIDPTSDTGVEGNETVTLALASGSGYTISTTSTVNGSILDNDVTPGTAVRTPVAPASPGRTRYEYHSSQAFAALKSNGSVVTWGDSGYGGDSSSVATQLTGDVTQIFSTQTAFAA